MTEKELRAKLKALREEIKSLREQAESEEDAEKRTSLKQQIDAKLAEFNETREDIDRAAALKDMDDYADRSVDPPPVSDPDPPEGDTRSRPQVGRDRRSLEPYRTFGDQMQAVARAANGDIDPRLIELRAAATGAGENVPHEGGFLVEKDFTTDLFKGIVETGQVSSRINRLQIGAGSNGMKFKTFDETSRADGSRFGGVRGYWTGEAAQINSSTPKFREVELTLRKLAALWYATDELLADAVALESFATRAFTEELAFKLDDSIINGDGAGKPLGILNAGATVSIAKETGQAATTFLYENALNMWARITPSSLPRAVWFINNDVYPQLFSMHQIIGTAGAPVYLPANGLSGQPYGTLFGRPVVPIEQCATLGTVGDVIFADVSEGYILIEKGGVEAAVSMHLRFDYDESVFRFIMRVDGQPWRSAPLTPFKGTNTLSEFVTCATRS